jgi:hypothetical protein
MGGEYRLGPLDIRTIVDMRSPDGKTDLRFGGTQREVWARVGRYALDDASG